MTVLKIKRHENSYKKEDLEPQNDWKHYKEPLNDDRVLKWDHKDIKQLKRDLKLQRHESIKKWETEIRKTPKITTERLKTTKSTFIRKAAGLIPAACIKAMQRNAQALPAVATPVVRQQLKVAYFKRLKISIKRQKSAEAT